MKKVVSAFLCLLGSGRLAQAQSIQFTIDAGLLKSSDGSAPVPAGPTATPASSAPAGLLQLIASPSNTFVAPTATSFVSGDNVLLYSFAMNYNGGTTGETLNTFSIATTNVVTGEELLLRWYPTLAATTTSNGPGAGTTYGQARSDVIENSNDPSETKWVAPAGGSSVDLDYFTMSDGGGIHANATGDASFSVVPEPSSYTVLGIFLLGLVCLRTCLNLTHAAESVN